MSVTLALLLAVPLCGGMVSEPATFEEMLDSAQIIVIGRVDSIWYPIDPETGPHTHVLAELLTVYSKDTTFIMHANLIHIAYAGGRTGPDRWLRVHPSVHFEKGELFLAPVEPHPKFYHIKEETIYRVLKLEWKYTLANDSLCMGGEGILPLGKALEDLSETFVEYEK